MPVAPLRIATLFASVVLFDVSAGGPSPPQDTTEPTDRGEVFSAAGLRNLDGVWVCPAEARYLRMAVALEDLEREFLTSRRAAREQVARALRHRALLGKLQHRYETQQQQFLQGRIAAIAVERFHDEQRQLSSRIAAARERLRNQFDGGNQDSELSQRVKQHALARLRLEAALVSMQRLRPQIRAAYQKLAASAPIQAASQAVSEGESADTMGPSEELLETSNRVNGLRGQLLTGPVPVYRDGYRYRIGATFNHSASVSLRIVEDEPLPIVLSRQQAEAARLEPLEGKAARTLAIDGQSFRAIPFRIDTLHIGGAELTDLTAWIVAADEDDPGPHLGVAAIPDHLLRIDARRLEASMAKP